jgi:hypothetical protein
VTRCSDANAVRYRYNDQSAIHHALKKTHVSVHDHYTCIAAVSSGTAMMNVSIVNYSSMYVRTSPKTVPA